MEKVTITPSMAEKLLEGNKNNRNVSAGQVEKFARDMKSGTWQFNGETIKVGKDGTLLDGQHRLLACCKANVPFETAYIEGLDNDVISSIDIGKKRTDGDVLAMHGYLNSKELSAVVRKLLLVEKGLNPIETSAKGQKRYAVTTSEILQYCETNSRETKVIQEVANHRACTRKIGILSSLVSFYFILFERAGGTAEATTFFQNLLNLDRPFSTPADLLRRTFWENAAKKKIGERRRDYDEPILLVKAWNATISNLPIKRLYVQDKDRENPPSILGVN